MYDTRLATGFKQNYLCWNIESDRIICLTININEKASSHRKQLGRAGFSKAGGLRKPLSNIARGALNLSSALHKRAVIIPGGTG
ncbi:hypothetical protein Tagg_0819 [Thermosphaera aggregans DSM 11486]|jgi:hypothetical protein|uniref:Uncharacterized protein n=1 Tax=Thermosphaera aggregans (strain DSM 11486 / M11TL) TaxID=633148 RepID=D5U1U2_THEAM|nr:hypothetical protein Tagg_0819 [Thermosphaera aggregans DSM 11486]